MFGSISIRPCDAVNVVVSAPDCSAPCTAPAAPPSLCISCTTGTLPQMFLSPSDAIRRRVGHRRGRRDRKDRADLVDPIGDMGDGGVAVHRGSRAHWTGVELPHVAMGAAIVGGRFCSGTISIAWQGHCSTQTAQPVQRDVDLRSHGSGPSLTIAVFRAGGEAVVAFEAVAAGQAALGLVQRRGSSGRRHFGEPAGAGGGFQQFVAGGIASL
jgi:hypothetical protein